MISVSVACNNRLIQRHDFEQERIRIGRAPDNEIQLDNPVLSRHHLEILRRGSRWRVRDLGSQNGFHLNGRARSSDVLNNGDVISVGKFVLAVSWDPIRDRLGGESHALASAVEEGETLQLAPRDEPSLPLAHLRIRQGTPSGLFRLSRECFYVGTHPRCQLRLLGWTISSRLALIVRGLGGYHLVNVSRRGRGVYLNGKPVALRERLHDGDRLEFHDLLAQFHHGAPRL